MEINGEPARGISHTRAIELIQAGGSKVVLLLRPGVGLGQDGSKCSFQTIKSIIDSLCNTEIFVKTFQYIVKYNI